VKQRSTNIIAQDEKDALLKGAKELNTSESNIQLNNIDDNKYQVSAINADAEVEISISDDGMSATINEYYPPQGSGADLDRERLKQQINYAGIVTDTKNLDAVLQKIQNQEPVKNLEIARGTPPVEPRDAYIQIQGNTDYPVFAKDVIGVASLPEKPRNGKGVDGRTLYPQDNREPSEVENPRNSGWVIQEQTREVIAKGYGKVVKKQGQIKIKPLFKPSEDGFSLYATLDYLDFHEERITVERIKQAIADLGCRKAEVYEKTIAKSLKRAKKQEAPQKGVLVATGGMQPQEPREGSIELYGNTDYPVFPGNTIGRLIPPVKAQPGQTIDGRSIPLQDDTVPEDIKPPERGGWQIDENTNDIVARGYGKVKKDGKQIQIKPLLGISEDYLYIHATLYHQDYFDKSISFKDIKKLILQISSAAQIQEKEITRALKEAAKTGEKQKKVVIAQGVPPVQGEDSKLNLKDEQEEEEEENNEDEEGNIDYREISTLISARENEVVATLLPPTPGKSGTDIFGREIPPNKGQDLNISAGENVQAVSKTAYANSLYESGYISEQDANKYSDEQIEITEFVALASGALKFEGNTISVTELFETKGDVDYSTGNIRLEKGSVKINGTVLSGFTVSTPQDIYVNGTIEDALAEAGNNITVKGGIVSGEWGKVTAKGSISAHYIENAHIECGQDLTVTQNISNSNINAKGFVYAKKGKGAIQGGTIRSNAGIEVNETGSEYRVRTRIILGNEFGENQELVDEMEKLKADVDRIDHMLGDQDPGTILNQSPPEKKDKIIKLLKFRTSSLKRIQTIKEEIKQEKQQKLQEATQAKAKIKGTIHPDTEIIIAGRRYLVQETMHNTTFYYDPDTDKVATE